MGDHLVYEDAVSTELYTTSEFTQKQYLYVNDNNNGSYSSQIVLDTTSLSNSGYWIGWSEAFILMPLVLQFECGGTARSPLLPSSTTATDATCLDWVAGMKNGYWQMIHAMTVEFNNRNVVQQVPFLNVFSSFRAMTSWSDSDLKNWGAICGFYPDTADSWLYNNISNTTANVSTRTQNMLGSSGTGICNNRNCKYISLNTLTDTFGAVATVVNAGIAPLAINLATKCTSPNASIRQTFNCGLQQRQSWINFNATPVGTGGQPVGQPYPTYGGANPAGYIQVFNAGGTGGQGYIGSTINQFVSNNQQGIMPLASYETVFQASITAYTLTSNANGTGRSIEIPAVIRLKDICNFFEKIPLLKGSTMRIYLNTNQSYFTTQYINGQLSATAAAAGTVGTVNETTYSAISLTSSPYILGGGATNPIMLASSDLGQGGYNVNPLTALNSNTDVQGANPRIATAVPVNVGISIAKTQFNQLTQQSSAITQVRLYAPAFQMNPLAETRFLELTPTKKVLYNDIFQFYFPNQSANANINILVSNGIPNIKQVIVIPFLTSTGTSPNGPAVPTAYQSANNGGGNVAVGDVPIISSTLLSPFSTAGATPDPIVLSNFQILISGTTLFQQQLQYGYEEFYEQMVSINQLNGSLTTGLGSGLIGYKEWQYLYRYYVGNASRIIPSEEGMARSVQIQCVNKSAVPIDLMVFVEYEKSITINMATGQEIA
jgi:hypothetical protein